MSRCDLPGSPAPGRRAPRVAGGSAMRDNPPVGSSESIVELIVRVGSGVTAGVGLVFTALAAIWVVSSPDSDGSWIPVLPWAVITLIAIVLFAVLLARSRSRHAGR